jgi:hypothetical protein
MGSFHAAALLADLISRARHRTAREARRRSKAIRVRAIDEPISVVVDTAHASRPELTASAHAANTITNTRPRPAAAHQKTDPKPTETTKESGPFYLSKKGPELIEQVGFLPDGKRAQPDQQKPVSE